MLTMVIAYGKVTIEDTFHFLYFEFLGFPNSSILNIFPPSKQKNNKVILKKIFLTKTMKNDD